MAETKVEVLRSANFQIYYCRIEAGKGMDRHLVERAVGYHGKGLLDQFYKEKASPHLSHLNFEQSPLSVFRQDAELNYKLQNFVAKKSDILFKPVADAESYFIQDKEREEHYAVMPPLEAFMGIPDSSCRKHIFQTLQKDDLLMGIVAAVQEAGLTLLLMCLDGGKAREILHMKLLAFCPLRELPRYYAHESPLEAFSIKDKVRVVILSVDGEEEKVVVSMDSKVLPPSMESVKLGLVSDEDFPVHFRNVEECMVMVFSRGDHKVQTLVVFWVMKVNPVSRKTSQIGGRTYSDMLETEAAFANPSNVSYMCELTGIQEQCPPSLMRGLHRMRVPETEMAESLRTDQSRRWALKSVAMGVSCCKKEEYPEAMSYFNRALEMHSTCVEAFVGKGAVYANKSSYTLAIEEFGKALEIEPNHPNARKYMSQTLTAKGKEYEADNRIDEAIRCFKQALMFDEQDTDVQDCIRKIEHQQRRNQEQLQHAAFAHESEKLMQRSPDSGSSSDSDNQTLMDKTVDTLRLLLKQEKLKKSKHKKRKRSGSERRKSRESDEALLMKSSEPAGKRRRTDDYGRTSPEYPRGTDQYIPGLGSPPNKGSQDTSDMQFSLSSRIDSLLKSASFGGESGGQGLPFDVGKLISLSSNALDEPRASHMLDARLEGHSLNEEGKTRSPGHFADSESRKRQHSIGEGFASHPTYEVTSDDLYSDDNTSIEKHMNAARGSERNLAERRSDGNPSHVRRSLSRPEDHPSVERRSEKHQSTLRRSGSHSSDLSRSECHSADVGQSGGHRSDSKRSDGHRSNVRSESHRSTGTRSEDHQYNSRRSEGHTSDVRRTKSYASSRGESNVKYKDEGFGTKRSPEDSPFRLPEADQHYMNEKEELGGRQTRDSKYHRDGSRSRDGGKRSSSRSPRRSDKSSDRRVMLEDRKSKSDHSSSPEDRGLGETLEERLMKYRQSYEKFSAEVTKENQRSDSEEYSDDNTRSSRDKKYDMFRDSKLPSKGKSKSDNKMVPRAVRQKQTTRNVQKKNPGPFVNKYKWVSDSYLKQQREMALSSKSNIGQRDDSVISKHDSGKKIRPGDKAKLPKGKKGIPSDMKNYIAKFISHEKKKIEKVDKLTNENLSPRDGSRMTHRKSSDSGRPPRDRRERSYSRERLGRRDSYARNKSRMSSEKKGRSSRGRSRSRSYSSYSRSSSSSSSESSYSSASSTSSSSSSSGTEHRLVKKDSKQGYSESSHKRKSQNRSYSDKGKVVPQKKVTKRRFTETPETAPPRVTYSKTGEVHLELKGNFEESYKTKADKGKVGAEQKMPNKQDIKTSDGTKGKSQNISTAISPTEKKPKQRKSRFDAPKGEIKTATNPLEKKMFGKWDTVGDKISSKKTAEKPKDSLAEMEHFLKMLKNKSQEEKMKK